MALVSKGFPPTRREWKLSAWRRCSSCTKRRDRGVDRAVGPEAHELRRHPHHLREAQERNAGQLLISLLEDPPGVVDEGTVAGHVRRRAALDLLLHRLGVPGVVEGVSVGPAQAVEGHDRQELDLARELAAGEDEELLEAARGGDHRRASIEDVAGLLVDVRPPARLVPGLEDGGPEAQRLEANRRRQPTEPTADHRGPRRAAHWTPREGRSAVNARPSETPGGGRPRRIRARSSRVVRIA